MSADWECPHCKNRVGCVFGTCIECGFNYLDKTFHWCKIDADLIEYLPFDLQCRIIDKHHERTQDLFKRINEVCDKL